MYKNEIRALECLAPQDMASETRARIIAPMRAAEPKDEAAEREHCRSAAISFLYGAAGLLGVTIVPPAAAEPVAERLLRERAAVRGPLQARIVELERANTFTDKHTAQQADEIERLRAALAALKSASAPVRCSVCNHYKGAAHPGWCHAREDGE